MTTNLLAKAIFGDGLALRRLAHAAYEWKEHKLPRAFEREALRGKRHLIGAEIGVLRGDHAASLLRCASVERLFLVDPYLACPDVGQAELDRAKVVACKRFSKDQRVVFVMEDSIVAAGGMPPLDFAYLDGNHTYPVVKVEIPAWWGTIKPGGWLGGHDFAIGDQFANNGVIQAVTEFTVKNGLQLYVSGMDWWVRKGGIS